MKNIKIFFNEYNKWIVEKQKLTLKYYSLDESLLYPKNKKGEIKLCGVWDFEGKYTRFKTLGAKRYLYEEDGELYLTVAGLSKRNGIEYMKGKNVIMIMLKYLKCLMIIYIYLLIEQVKIHILILIVKKLMKLLIIWEIKISKLVYQVFI